MIYTKINNKSKTLMLKSTTLSKYIKGGIEQAMDDIGKIVQTKVRRNILNEKKSGRLYLIRLQNRIKRHTASSPGQTAANITGSYYKSIGYERQGSNKVTIGSTSIIGKYLEEGTKKKKGSMKPRPGLKNAVKDSQKIIDEYLYKRINDIINK